MLHQRSFSCDYWFKGEDESFPHDRNRSHSGREPMQSRVTPRENGGSCLCLILGLDESLQRIRQICSVERSWFRRIWGEEQDSLVQSLMRSSPRPCADDSIASISNWRRRVAIHFGHDTVLLTLNGRWRERLHYQDKFESSEKCHKSNTVVNLSFYYFDFAMDRNSNRRESVIKVISKGISIFSEIVYTSFTCRKRTRYRIRQFCPKMRSND